LHQAYDDTGWRDAELVDAFAGSLETYFDQVSRVRLQSWSKDRVVLLGDAASSTSLFGEGSSNAIAGAARLTRTLAGTVEPAAALARYERERRRIVRQHERLVPLMSHLLVPSTSGSVRLRNLLLARC